MEEVADPLRLCSAINPFAVESTNYQQVRNVVMSRRDLCYVGHPLPIRKVSLTSLPIARIVLILKASCFLRITTPSRQHRASFLTIQVSRPAENVNGHVRPPRRSHTAPRTRKSRTDESPLLTEPQAQKPASPAVRGKGIAGREPWGLPHTLSLQEVTALVLRDDLQACSNSKSQQGDKRIPEANAVHVVRACPGNQLPCDLIHTQEVIQDR